MKTLSIIFYIIGSILLIASCFTTSVTALGGSGSAVGRPYWGACANSTQTTLINSIITGMTSNDVCWRISSRHSIQEKDRARILKCEPYPFLYLPIRLPKQCLGPGKALRLSYVNQFQVPLEMTSHLASSRFAKIIIHYWKFPVPEKILHLFHHLPVHNMDPAERIFLSKADASNPFGR